MKHRFSFLPILLSILFMVSSCNYFQKKSHSSRRIEKAITKVDVSIDTSNSYNNLFLDSTVVRSYLRQDTTLNDILKNRIISFYNNRNFQYAWFSSDGLAEQTHSFWNLLMNYRNYSNDTTVYNRALAKKMEPLFSQDSLTITNDSVYQKMELDLTKLLYLYAEHEYKDNLQFDMKSLEWYVPHKRMTLDASLDSTIAREGRFSNENAPTNVQYVRLREMLQKYKTIRDTGGWDSIYYKQTIRKIGYEGDEIRQLKRRLKREGFLTGEDSTFTNLYDSTLYLTLKQVKTEYGYNPDAVISRSFIEDLNISIDERLQQILVNMERMRWIPAETSDTASSIVVNIPEFKLYMYENGKPAWDMVVVVGKEGNNTTVFTGKLNTIVFSPYWNIPSSIVKKEILPNMERNSNYLARNHMEIVGGGAIPTIRQKPGPWNSLGGVKFLFPNNHNIYFHDSPAKALFNRDKRSYSHGCIRLKEPAKMAQYLLNDSAKWNAEKVKEAMNTQEEKHVRLKKPVPVMITYFTAWVRGDAINFREDIYGHDERMAKKMFLDPMTTTRHKKK